MQNSARTYLPAAGNDWGLPLYDPFVKLLGGDHARAALLDQAALRPRYRVLDVGCGTGTLAVFIKRLYPSVEVIGLDPDPKALAQSKKKARRADVSIRFDQGFSDELPYADASFDRVFSSFMFHHVRAGDRGKMLREIRRVLKPGGTLHMLDFGASRTQKSSRLARWFHSNERLKDNSTDRILALFNDAGFVESKRVLEKAMLFGHLRTAYFQAAAPLSAKRGCN